MAARCWRVYLRLLETHPWKTQTIGTGVVVGFGDIITQQVVERKGRHHDVMRTMRMSAVGLCIGPILRTWYLRLDRIVVASARPKLDALKKMVLDQALFSPCFIAAFFGVNSAMAGQSFEQYKAALKEKYVTTVIASYKLWPAVQIITFSVIPLQHRVLFVQLVAVLWNTYLCWMINKPSQHVNK